MAKRDTALPINPHFILGANERPPACKFCKVEGGSHVSYCWEIREDVAAEENQLRLNGSLADGQDEGWDAPSDADW